MNKIKLILLIKFFIIIINSKIIKSQYTKGIIQEDFKNIKCFSQAELEIYREAEREIYNPGYGIPLGIQVSERVTHQLISRIYGIFLKEVLEYNNVTLVSNNFNTKNPVPEWFKIYKTANNLELSEIDWGMPIIDLEVWMYPDYHLLPSSVKAAGPVTQPGRFGWFVPKFNNKNNIFNIANDDELQHNIFLNRTNQFYNDYVIDDNLLKIMISKFKIEEKFVASHCKNITCVTLLGQYYFDTAFITTQIENELNYKFYINVIWFGKNLKIATDWLYEKYNSNEYRKLNKKYLILNWSPSEITNADIEYNTISMPKCEDLTSANETLCKYEMIPILKYYPSNFWKLRNAYKSIFDFNIPKYLMQPLLINVNEKSKNNPLITNNEMKQYYNKLACNWLKSNPNELIEWINKQEINVTIGGIFPLTGMNQDAYKNVLFVVKMAQRAIINSPLKLKLNVHLTDGKCRADTVMNNFIHYYEYIDSPVIGILGPACSETVEPIAGISKHTRIPVVSYSAEGALFTDRETYPYFFRTIGSNRQYEVVYLNLFKKFGWRRVASLTEDGQKYTEYISHMEALMKQDNMELISKKFPKDVSKEQMRSLLMELKNKHAKIIIADIYNDNARLVLCEAYHLEMTARQGYVWFLPVWLSKNWLNNSQNEHFVEEDCKTEELIELINGHFSLKHSAFADNATIIQHENRTISQWFDEYQSNEISDYAGFIYDAIWVYALAIVQLLKEKRTALSNLRTPEITKRFVDIIWRTNFTGVSGKIRFDEGGSRINNISILQWNNGEFIKIGQYVPEVDYSNEKIKLVGGEMFLNESAIHWLTGEQPKDGFFDCNMAGLAKLLNTDCETATLILIVILCIISVISISLASFIFWKRRYDSILKKNVKALRLYGIDLLSQSSNASTLDKWEVSKDNIVLNRRLGEGAFGTVYGGEAKLCANGWTAVAVKTLKMGSSTDDRLDFLCEAEAMKLFEHNNIIKLLGVCLQNEPIFTIMEFMLYGDLKTFLLARRHLVGEKVHDDADISSKRLTMYATDIARGLSYLAEKKYVHRDIACRNCLVNAQRVAKIGDFGMARSTFDNDYYRFTRKGMLPVRWMSPEALTLGLFSTSSDVWSFGILLYEIITFGSFPYQGLTNNEVLEKLKLDGTFDVPAGVKPQLAALMRSCFNRETKKRPSASEIVEYISNYPRLLTPSLEGPLSSIMVETNSDEMELIPGLRKRVNTHPNIDILEASNLKNNLDNEFLSKLEHQPNRYNEINIQHDEKNLPSSSTSSVDNKQVPSTSCNELHSTDDNNMNYYSPMTPLLRMNSEISNSSLSLRRYVPMHSIGKKLSSNNNNSNISFHETPVKVQFLKNENNNSAQRELVKII